MEKGIITLEVIYELAIILTIRKQVENNILFLLINFFTTKESNKVNNKIIIFENF